MATAIGNVWVKLRYGTLVAAGVTITGITIWNTVPESPRIAADDIIELWEGLQERANAVDAQPIVTNIQQVLTWSNHPSGLQFATPFDGLVTYLTFAGTNDLETVRTNQSFFTFSRRFKTRVGRHLWSDSTLYEVAANTSTVNPAVTGKYEFAGILFPLFQRPKSFGLDDFVRSPQHYIYTNVSRREGTNTYVLIDLTPQNGWALLQPQDYDPSTSFKEWDIQIDGPLFESQTPGEWYRTLNVVTNPDSYRGEWRSYTINFSTIAPTDIVVTAVGIFDTNTLLFTIDSNSIRDASAFVYEDQINAIDITKPSREAWRKFDDALRAIIPEFVERIETNGLVFNHTVTGLFATLEIGDLTNRFTKTATNGVKITFGPAPNYLSKFHLDERYKILNALSQTVIAVDWHTNNVSEESSTVDPDLIVSEGGFETVVDTGLSDINDPWKDLPIGGVPSYWQQDNISVDIDASGAFFTSADVPPSRTYTGDPIGPTVDSTDSMLQPLYDFSAEYRLQKRQNYLIEIQVETFSPFDPIAGATFKYVSYDRDRLSTTIDNQEYLTRDATIRFVLDQGLQGLGYTVEHYAIEERRRDAHYDFRGALQPTQTFFQVGGYVVVETTSGTMVGLAETNFSAAVPPNMDASQVTDWDVGILATGKSKNPATPFPPTGTDPNFRRGTGQSILDSFGQGRVFFGSRWELGSSIITWQFTRCADPIP